MNFAKQLYDRAMVDLQGPVRSSFRYQEKPILGEINACLANFGTEGTVSILNDAIAFSQSYSGREPYWQDVFQVLNELRNEDYPHLRDGQEMRDTGQFQADVKELSNNHQLAMFTVDDSGESKRLDGSVQPRPPEPPSMLEQALSHHKEQLRVAERDGDEAGAQRARSTLDLIQRDIDRQVSQQPQQQQPQVSPEQAAADKEYYESEARHDAAQGYRDNDNDDDWSDYSRDDSEDE